MKSKADKILVLLIIGLVYPSIINTNFNLTNKQKTVLNNPDITESYIENYIEVDPIFINGTATGVGAHNWTWAVNQSWCSGNGIYSDPYIIENLKIKGTGFEIGIEIWNSNVSFIIQDCLITNTDLAIWGENVNHSRLIDNDCSNNNLGIGIQYSNNNTISGNTANDNNQQGIYLYDSDHNYITENTVNNNDNGIELDTSNNNYIGGNTVNNNPWNGIYLYDGNYNTISGNTVNNNDNGIYFDYECDNNTISGNLVKNNTLYGVYFDTCIYNTVSGNVLEDNEAGIFLYVAINNFIIGNIVRDNTMSGINFDEDSDYQEITDNIIYNNTIGIDIWGLNDNNLVYNNFFLKNGKHAFDDGTGNKWNSSSIGNYWDNHTGPDVSPQDGIVDNPYTFIDGPADSIDYMPIAEDGAPRLTIISPSDGQRFGRIAPTFNLQIVDVKVFETRYTLDGGLNNYTFTGNGTINQIVWDVLPEGSVTITFYARDIAGNVAFEEVIVVKDLSIGLDPGVVAIIVVVSVIGGVVIIGAILVVLEKKGKISFERIKEKIKGYISRRK